MSYGNIDILRDKEGNPIPQYYNKDLKRFEPMTGSSGLKHVQIKGLIIDKEDLTLIMEKLDRLIEEVK